jgi:hypothetical protein
VDEEKMYRKKLKEKRDSGRREKIKWKIYEEAEEKHRVPTR